MGERQALSARIDELDGWFRPADRRLIGVFVNQVLGAMPFSSEHDDGDLTGLADVYATALAPFPLFAVKGACEAALRGKVGQTGGRFRPTPPELALAAERELGFFVRERRTIRNILDAQVIEPQPRGGRNVSGEVRDMIAEIAAAQPANEIARGLGKAVAVNDGLTPKQRAERRIEALRDKPLPQLSEAALAIFMHRDAAE